ncbi:hypothetical protein A0H81_13456 [Grifola frondosa]|uniref:DRBM domain-containing protein n=1 Tax=Grifola frondosa TaxID=5627 RepID=A0A1C7LRJ9_GRIFR|nr:hypothetical protein A0H81_13456 [Grifola frondosa]
MAESYHWRMQLNNYLQVRGVEYGRANGCSQSAVKEEAARQVLSALVADRRARDMHEKADFFSICFVSLSRFV